MNVSRSIVGPLVLIFAAVLLASYPNTAVASETGARRAAGSVDVAAPLIIRANQDLVLGAILLRAPRQSDNRMRTRNDDRVPPGISMGAATIEIVGQSGQVVSLTVPAHIVIATESGGDSVTFEAVAQPILDDASVTTVLQLDAHGVLHFRIRGHVVDNPASMPGRYRGVLTATVQYD